MLGLAPQQGADPGEQLLHPERLGQVVVGAAIDRIDLLRPAVACRQDEDRHRAAIRPPSLQNLSTVELRQSEIEHHEIVIFGVTLEPGRFSIICLLDDIPRGSKGIGEISRDLFLVLDDQDAHVHSFNYLRPEMMAPVWPLIFSSNLRPSGRSTLISYT